MQKLCFPLEFKTGSAEVGGNWTSQEGPGGAQRVKKQRGGNQNASRENWERETGFCGEEKRGKRDKP